MDRRTLLRTLPIIAIPSYFISNSKNIGKISKINNISSEVASKQTDYIIGLRRIKLTQDRENSIDIDELRTESRDILRTVIEGGRYETDTIPSELKSKTAENIYVKCSECNRSGEYFQIIIDDVGAAIWEQFDFDIRLVDEYMSLTSPIKIEFKLTNISEDNVSVISGPFPPFGILNANSENQGGSIVFWNDGYSSNDSISTKLGTVTGATKQEVHTTIRPDESVTKQYEIRLRDYYPHMGFNEEKEFIMDVEFGYLPKSAQIGRNAKYKIRFNIG